MTKITILLLEPSLPCLLILAPMSDEILLPQHEQWTLKTFKSFFELNSKTLLFQIN
uniref:Uncharacterized protein n=1 Tax=Octopus bimaculoides TaxID=37653 RepID=A0A0L8ICQ1_OCTBM